MRLQSELASQVIRGGDLREDDVRFIAGGDVAFDTPRRRAVGAVVVLAYPSLEAVEQVVVETPLTFPYVPGLLSFRETPVLLDAFEQVRQAPDLLMADGHGYAHPRRFGFACHLGLLLDVPTIGLAKSRLIGTHGSVGEDVGARADLVDDGEIIGSVLRTRTRVRPVYVSIGHRIALQAAERWALATARRRVPEPTRLADALSKQAKRRMLDATLDVVVEQRAGEEGRWEWEPDTDEVVFRYELEPLPVHYGCSVDIVNAADRELLDVMIVDPAERGRGERMPVRVVDVLERSDGDHKLLALPLDARVKLAGVRDRIWDWYVRHEKPVTRWGGEDAAIEIIRACRESAVEMRSK